MVGSVSAAQGILLGIRYCMQLAGKDTLGGQNEDTVHTVDTYCTSSIE